MPGRRSSRAAGAGGAALRRPPAAAARLATLVFLAVAAGCATGQGALVRPAPWMLPPGSPLQITSLADSDAWLRHHLMFGAPDSALAILQPIRRGPRSDRLLTAMQSSLVLRESGDFAASNELLEWVDLEAERRRTRSVSETAASFVVNDRVMAYMPSPGELAMVPYYRMMNSLDLGDLGSAAVEARRMSSLLAGPDRGAVRRCREDAMLQYISGLVFEAAGERNDALVSLRQAEASFDSCEPGSGITRPAGFGLDLARVADALGVDEVADSARARYRLAARGGESAGGELQDGEVLVVLERGFIAHLSEQAIHVPIFERDIEDLEGNDTESIAEVAAAITSRLIDDFLQVNDHGPGLGDPRAVQVGHAFSGAYILRLAWLGPQQPRRTGNPVRLVLQDSGAELARVADLSAIVLHEVEQGRRAELARLVSRGVARYLATRELEKKAEERGGELLGFVTGRMANLATNELERSDTRSWTLLPDEVSVARISLPAGRHELRLEALSQDEGKVGGVLDLGIVEVRAGGMTVVNRRVWSDPEPVVIRKIEVDDAD